MSRTSIASLILLFAPLIPTGAQDGIIERVRASVLKLSEGSMDKLRYAVKIAKEDWRDVFVAAGFGHDPLADRQAKSRSNASGLGREERVEDATAKLRRHA